ncbi:unnamed protein product [Menidia menidia]|uniref:(Atlantic silverside) hypothetical protein n=1 Tax=Menidia menidia TaxID=238744 RepID=A0A8S4B1R4_9TELE|nr:unnamed protein product [Menidia menidia]
MWTPSLHVVTICLFIQVAGCRPSCLLKGSIAHCGFRGLRWVPPLPPNITHLFLDSNLIGEINRTSLAGLEELQVLDLGGQKVPLVIRNGAFRGLKRLRNLNLGFNPGLQLEPLAFAGLSGLLKLHLFSCSLNNLILEDSYLEPLSSLQTLDLFANRIKRLRPATFFANMTNLTDVNLMLNNIDQICESDLVGFKGKHFKVFNLNSVHLKDMMDRGFNWQKCGNPFRGMSFQTLDLSGSGLGVLQLKLFFRAIDGTEIHHLRFSGSIGRGFSFNNLLDPDQETFEGLRNSSVLSLDLSKNRIFALQRGVFSPLKELKAIDLSKNKVNQIHRNAFDGLQGSLKMLNLSHNLLGEIYSYTFASLTNLKVLDLSHNHIGALGYKSFSGLPNLNVLNLTGNSLQSLGFPASLPSLRVLLLDDNKLTASSVKSITDLAGNATYLSVQDNRLTNLEDVFTFSNHMKRLRFLLYGGNTIRWCTLSTQVGQNDVGFLDLHSSSLQSIWAQGKCLHLFGNFGNVIRLDLSLNGLHRLPGGVFKGLASVLEMDLSSNALTYLQPDVLPKSLKSLNLANNFIASPDPAAFSSLGFLDLSGNRFHCNAGLRGFLGWLRETNVTFLRPAQELRCEFPSAFHNVPLSDYSARVLQR